MIGITTDDSETFLVKLEEKVGDVTGDGDTDDMISNRSADGRGRRSRALRKRRTGRNDDVTPKKQQRADSDEDDSADDICDDNDNDSDLENVPSKPIDDDIITVKHEPSDNNGQCTQGNQIQTPPVGDDQHAQSDQTQADVAQSGNGPQHTKDKSDGSADGGSHDGSSSTWNQSSTNDNDTSAAAAAGSQQVRDVAQ